MERDLISKTTSSDFFTKEGLRKLAGITNNIDYVMVIIKELVDNSLDEVEQKENGIIEVTICEKLVVWEIKIKDNGRGIPEKNIDNLINLTKDSRYSTKREYISPTRGCQGNALKTIIGIPCALGIENNQINIIAQGIKHQINAVIYPNNSVEIVNNKIIVGDTIGTEIIVNIPTNIFYKNYHNIEQNSDNAKREIIRHLEAIALFNPHITLGVKIEEVNDKNNHDKLTVSYQKNYPQRVEKIIKRNISSDIDIHWYSRIDFEKLAWGLIHEHPEKLLYKSSNKSNTPTFLGIFEKLSSRAKQTSVLGDYANHFKKMGDFKNLSIEEVNFILGEIYNNAKDETKPLKSSCLGCVGDYLKHEYAESYYKKINIGEDFIFEVFICKADNQFSYYGVNYTNINKDYFANKDDYFFSDCVEETKVSDILEIFKKQNYSYFVHIISPKLDYYSYAKDKIYFDEIKLKAIIDCLKIAGKIPIAKEKKIKPEIDKSEKIAVYPKNKAIAQVAQEVYNNMSSNGTGVLTMRYLFYGCRDKIQKSFTEYNNLKHYGTNENDYGYFRTVIDDLIDSNLVDMPTLVRDPKGKLLEPYSGIEIPIGTKQIDDYDIPYNDYQGILYIEKKGVLEILKEYDIGKEFDILICACEGYSVRALKTLLKKCSVHENFKIFCLHDADPDGYYIYQDLVNQLEGVQIIDLGLHIEEAIEKLKVEPETFIRKKALPSGLNLSNYEKLKFMEKIEQYKYTNKSGKPKTGKKIIGKRVELTLDNPITLVNWLRKKLRQHIQCKKIGDYREIKVLGEKTINSRIEFTINTKIKEVLDFDNYVHNLEEEKKEWIEKLTKIPRWRKEVRKILLGKPTVKWTSTIDDLVNCLFTEERINKIVKTVENKTLDKLKEKLAEQDNTQLSTNTDHIGEY